MFKVRKPRKGRGKSNQNQNNQSSNVKKETPTWPADNNDSSSNNSYGINSGQQ